MCISPFISTHAVTHIPVHKYITVVVVDFDAKSHQIKSNFPLSYLEKLIDFLYYRHYRHGNVMPIHGPTRGKFHEK